MRRRSNWRPALALARLSLPYAGRIPTACRARPSDSPCSDGLRHLVELARTGEVDQDAAGTDVLVPPITDRWDAVFDRAASGWWGQLMIAIRSHAREDLEQARLGYLRSDQLRPTPVGGPRSGPARRSQGDHPSAADLYARAVAQAPDLPAAAGRSHRSIARRRSTRRLPGDDQRRTKQDCLVTAGWSCSGLRALLADGQADTARALLDVGIEVPDLREGETLGALWRAAFGDRPLAYHYDFRMGHCSTTDWVIHLTRLIRAAPRLVIGIRVMLDVSCKVDPATMLHPWKLWPSAATSLVCWSETT